MVGPYCPQLHIINKTGKTEADNKLLCGTKRGTVDKRHAMFLKSKVPENMLNPTGACLHKLLLTAAVHQL